MGGGHAGSDQRTAAACQSPMARLGLLLVLLLTGCLGACVIVADPEGSAPYQAARPTHYTVLPGDTLYAIAFRLKIDWRDLARWNGLDNPSLIHPGQRLELQAPATGKKSKSRVAKTSAPAPAPRKAKERTARKAPDRSAKAKAATPSPAAPATSRVGTPFAWRWPASGPVLATFSDPAEAGRGIDVGGKQGDGVRAAAGGRVVYTGSGLRYYGNLVIIKHDDTFLSAYGYNEDLLVSQGDEVRAGQRIARMGLGPGKRPRLHFEIRVNGKPVDPLRYLPSRERGR